MFVLTADQKASRRTGDRVPEALDLLRSTVRSDGVALPFERTVGDEVQGLLSAAEPLVQAICGLTRLGGWRIGVGIGQVDSPLPPSARAASGAAFLAAREAVGHARSSPVDLAVAGSVGGLFYAAKDRAERAEAALWMLVSLLRRRTEEGWQVAELIESGSSGREAAAVLAITPSAVSQRAARAAVQEVQRGRELVVALLEASS